MPDLDDAFADLKRRIEMAEPPPLLDDAYRRSHATGPTAQRSVWRRATIAAVALMIAGGSLLFASEAFNTSHISAGPASVLPYPLAFTGADVPDPHWTHGQLWLMDQQGVRSTLAADPGDGVVPAWSPDGSQIAFDSEKDGQDQIWVMNADGTGLHQVTTYEPSQGSAINDAPSWSPDGSEIAFNCYDSLSGFHNLCVINSDGSNVRQLTDGINVAHDTAPIWLNGHQLMFSTNPGGDFAGCPQASCNSDQGANGSETLVVDLRDGSLNRVGLGLLDMTLSPDGSTIAYVCPTDGSYAICTTTNDLQGRRQVTYPTSSDPATAETDTSPAWLPDGRLSFLRSGNDFDGYHLFIVDEDGGKPTELLNLGTDVRGLSWGPAAPTSSDSPAPTPTDHSTPSVTSSPPVTASATNMLVSVRDDSDGSSDVYEVTPAGQLRGVLTGATDDSDAVWSPNGTKIAFVRLDRNGPCTDSNIYVADADGSRATRLTGDPADLQCEVPSNVPAGNNVIVSVGENDDEPAWSPDGSQIAWRTNCAGGNSGIGIMNADGSDQTCIGPDGNSSEPRWSPNGKLIAFDSDSGLPSGSFGTDIWTMRPDGSDMQRITTDGGGNIVQAWSPDGSTLLYQRSVDHSDYAWDLWTLDLATGERQQLTDWPGMDTSAVYSPDGSQIAFASDRFGDGATVSDGTDAGHAKDGLDVYVLTVKDGAVQRLTTFAPRSAWPSGW
jgi:Tol biopolymer transport system component